MKGYVINREGGNLPTTIKGQVSWGSSSDGMRSKSSLPPLGSDLLGINDLPEAL